MNIALLERQIGFAFKNKDLLMEALTHCSYVCAHKEPKIIHNERLEFLGDAVLELVVTDYLCKNLSHKTEGELTRMRTFLVQNDTLFQVAMNLRLYKFPLLSQKKVQNNDRAQHYILANAVEAIIGAVYLDQGYDSAQSFVYRILLSKYKDNLKEYKSPKCCLQEKMQEKLGITPDYRLIGESGTVRDKTFTIRVYLNDTLIARGVGGSKKEAEQKAAETTLLKIINGESV